MSIFRKERQSKVRNAELGVSKEELSDFFMSRSVDYGQAAKKYESNLGFPENVKSHYSLLAETLAGFYNPSIAPAVAADLDDIVDSANSAFDRVDQEFDGNVKKLATQNVDKKTKEELKNQYPGLNLQLQEITHFLSVIKEYIRLSGIKKVLQQDGDF